MSTANMDGVQDVAALGADEEPTIGRLVHDALQDVSTLVRSEIELAKVEVTADVKKAGKGGAFFAVAGVLGVLAVIFLFHTLALVIAVWLPEWAGYLIVTAFLLLMAGILALMGKSQFGRVRGKPERAIATTQETVAYVKAAATS